MNFNQQNPWGSLPRFGQQMAGQMQHPMGFGQMPPQMTPPIMQGMPGQQQPSGQMPMMGGAYGQAENQQQGMFGMPQGGFMQRMMGQMPHFMNSGMGGGFPFMNRQNG